MSSKLWHKFKWPEGVPHEITGYEKPLYTILDESAAKYPNVTYTIFADATRTFAQVKDTADRVANFLVSRGIKQGDRVAIFLPNIPQYPEIFFGILKAGGICVTCNPLYKTPELTAVKALEGSDVKTVVICNVKSYLPKLKGVLGSLLGKIPKVDRHEPGHFFFDDIVRSSKPETPALKINPNQDTALIIYTGGTTGTPKGACLSHANLVFNILSVHEWIRISERPGAPRTKLSPGGVHTVLGVLPWYHSYGLTLALLLSCYGASKLVCIPDPRAGKPPFTEVLKAIERYKVTLMAAVPTIYSAFVNHPLIDKFDLTSLIGCGSGAAAMPVELIKEFEKKTGSVIFEGYGLSETSPVLTQNPTNVEQRQMGAVGLPIPNTDIKIVDLETGLKDIPLGQDGEIAACGPQVMLGYWNKPEANQASFREIDGKRYLLTGDVGHIDEEGFVVITDRKKDMIIVGGFNVYPRDVEEVLYSHPKVALAAVIGIPDQHTGEAVKAFVQLKPGAAATEQEILDFCKDKMAGYKRPKFVEFRDTLPTSVIGKVLRRALRDEELKKLKAA
jgi:long-chain acyl-CoA synthetase